MAAAKHTIPTLYHVPFYASAIPQWLLYDLRVPSTSLAISEITVPQLREGPNIDVFSPRRVLPVIAFPNGTSIVESGAIALYILETYDLTHALHPPPSAQLRPRFLQGIFTYAAEAYWAVSDVLMLTLGKETTAQDGKKVAEAKAKFEKVVTAHLAREVGEEGWYLKEFSAVDVMFAFILMTAEYLDVGLVEDERVRAYHERLKARETYDVVFPRAALESLQGF